MTRTHLLLLQGILLAALSMVAAGQQSESSATGKSFVLVAHGGAGDYSKTPPDQIAAKRSAMTAAMKAGFDLLARGGSSIDAVETTIRIMEDSAAFDAGRGGYYARDGVPELDAAIMDGRTLRAGAVAAVQRIANPISLARLVMEKTPHVLLVSQGAEQFAQSQGVALVSPYYFFNSREWERYQKLKASNGKSDAASVQSGDVHGTVGVVALDQQGNLAAGTSTGGTTWKMPGRVGDSPLIGAGTYANNDSCAISATGTGEFFIRNVVAADISARMRYLHVSLEQAAGDVVMKELVAQKGDGGIIGVDRQGRVSAVFNTNGMMHGVVRADGNIVINVRTE
jgi:L-asparaginase / beta-aspartyl-peptidase